MTELSDSQFLEVARTLGPNAFSTFHFVTALGKMYPSTMESLIDQYGKGGAGAGTHYSAYSRIAHALDRLAKSKALVKLDYRDAPEDWGSPVIRFWCLPGIAPEFPEEIPSPETVLEGAKQAVLVNRYERNPVARGKCIEEWGTVCTVCGFDFRKRYGDIGIGYIHVHHLKPLSEIRSEYELDPVADLRPVCANCHCMLHRSVPALSIESLKSLLK